MVIVGVVLLVDTDRWRRTFVRSSIATVATSGFSLVVGCVISVLVVGSSAWWMRLCAARKLLSPLTDRRKSRRMSALAVRPTAQI